MHPLGVEMSAGTPRTQRRIPSEYPMPVHWNCTSAQRLYGVFSDEVCDVGKPLVANGNLRHGMNSSANRRAYLRQGIPPAGHTSSRGANSSASK